MTTFLQNFKDSSQEFKNVRSLVTAALLIALHTVLAYFVSFQVTPSLRISVSFLANVVTGAMFGPVVGFICGGVGDIVQFVIKPTGPYFWGWTINAALAGLIYGAFLYKKFPRKGKVFDIAFFIRVVLVLVIDTLLVNVLLGTYWVHVMYGKGFAFYLTTRFMKNIIQLPVSIILTYYVLYFVRVIKEKIE
jgi:ECF transporter S component (folate family)